MIQITPQMRVLVAVEPVDGRKGIDSLAAVCRQKLEADPFSGTVFVFRGRRGDSIKVLVYDGQGFWLAQKRLSKGRFRWWPTGTTARQLEAHQALLLLAAGNPDTPAAPVWRPWYPRSPQEQRPRSFLARYDALFAVVLPDSPLGLG